VAFGGSMSQLQQFHIVFLHHIYVAVLELFDVSGAYEGVTHKQDELFALSRYGDVNGGHKLYQMAA
jgi:hypothetical protein